MNERKLHYLLLVAFSLSNKMIIGQTNREKLMPGQPKILEFLLGHDGCTQKEIAKACILDKSTVTSLITRMLLCGLVRKDSDLPDRRTNCIYLTEEGRKKLCRYSISLKREMKSGGSRSTRRSWRGYTSIF